MTIEDILVAVSEERKDSFNLLRKTILDNLPQGFEETVSYGMISYVVPHKIYPQGYHCNPNIALPFLSIASQKNTINLYHMGIYADSNLYDWFVSEFPKHTPQKLDIGKSCIRFKKMNEIPFNLLGSLVGKMTTNEWINLYERTFKKPT
jgi:hypothetical protein